MAYSKRLTIFEGPDGAGKTTAARAYAELTGARYVHLTAMPHVTTGLARMYVEAMLPAVLGYQDVVLDRCWLSEAPYGMAFRSGADRLGITSRRMLERLAMRCGAVVVHCQPPWERVRQTYLNRRNEEYLDTETQLRVVYDLYESQRTDLPVYLYDYTVEPSLKPLLIDSLRTIPHPLNLQSAGNWHGDYVLVGEGFADRKDADAFYQWPFASFSDSGCSQWLTEQLEINDVNEYELFWLNADQDLSVLYDIDPVRIIALGKEATAKLYELKIGAISVPHPQYHKRFNFGKSYELFDYLS